MGGEWKLQDAKARFSEVFDLAVRGTPQVVTRRGKDAVVMVSRDHYDELTRPRRSLISLMLDAPTSAVEINFDRPKDSPRDVDLGLDEC